MSSNWGSGWLVPPVMPYPASYFRLSMFRQCRHLYKLHYVDGLAKECRKPRLYLTMGEHVHGALRALWAFPALACGPRARQLFIHPVSQVC